MRSQGEPGHLCESRSFRGFFAGGNYVFHRVDWKEEEGLHFLVIKATTWEELARLVAPAMRKGGPAALFAARGQRGHLPSWHVLPQELPPPPYSSSL